jgi:hypothetical protein
VKAIFDYAALDAHRRPCSARCLPRALPCEQPLEAHLSGTIAQHGVEYELREFCVSGVARYY